MRWQRLLLCATFALSACETRPRASAADRSAPLTRTLPSDTALLTRDAQRSRQRVDQELPTPASALRVRCPDESLPHGSAAETTLFVRLDDARSVRRDLLPFTLRGSLESGAFRVLDERSLTPELGRALSGEGEASVSDDEIGRIRRKIAVLDQRRYVAKLLVDNYAGPRLLRRKDAPKSEWDAGLFEGRLVVQDLVSRQTLCQAPLRVRGDASRAPISKRLRERTREVLRQELYERTWAALGGALGSISSVFNLAPRMPDGS